MRPSVLLLASIGLSACAHRAAPPVSKVRFANADPVGIVDDRRDVPEAPAERPHTALRGFDIAVTWRVDRGLSAAPAQRALGTNSLDEVPDSTWFENRIGVRDVSLEELARGPGDGRGPDLSAPLRVIRGKFLGTRPGFIAEDASGVKWLIKPEPRGEAAESATDIVLQRLFWAIGYHVPENHVGYIERDQVVVADGATLKDSRGRKRSMTVEDLDGAFARATPGADGRYRILASRLLPGTPIGGILQRGVRDDDPNDTIPHERRRELRGLYVFAAWLQHTDLRELNTLETWQEDPLHPGRHVVFHYLIDFGTAMGLYNVDPHGGDNARPDDVAVEKQLDPAHLRAFFSFGLWKRSWEGTEDPDIPGVGAFDVEHYDPAGFTPYQPYVPFQETDAADAFWAVKILLRITPEHIRTALEAAQYEDPRAVEYLSEVLVGRQRKTARYWLARVSPLDDFEVSAGDLCFVDLVTAHELETGDATYRAEAFDWSGASLGALADPEARGSAGRRCLRGVPTGADHDDYTIVTIAVERGGKTLPAVEVHLARAPSGDLRVVGVERRLGR